MIHSGDIKEFLETFLIIQDTWGGHSSNIHDTFKLHSDNNHDIFRGHSGTNENFEIFKTHSGDVKVTCMIYSGDI